MVSVGKLVIAENGMIAMLSALEHAALPMPSVGMALNTAKKVAGLANAKERLFRVLKYATTKTTIVMG